MGHLLYFDLCPSCLTLMEKSQVKFDYKHRIPIYTFLSNPNTLLLFNKWGVAGLFLPLTYLFNLQRQGYKSKLTTYIGCLYPLSQLTSIHTNSLLPILEELWGFFDHFTLNLLVWPLEEGHRLNITTDIGILYAISYLTAIHSYSLSLIFEE